MHQAIAIILTCLIGITGCAVKAVDPTLSVKLVDSLTSEPLARIPVRISRFDGESLVRTLSTSDSDGVIAGLRFLHDADGLGITLKAAGYHTSAVLVRKNKLYLVAALPDSIDMTQSEALEARDLFQSRWAASVALRDGETVILKMVRYAPVNVADELRRFAALWHVPGPEDVRKISARQVSLFEAHFLEYARECFMWASDQERYLELCAMLRRTTLRQPMSEPNAPPATKPSAEPATVPGGS